MKYRAKITRILSFVESHYNLKKCAIFRDAKDAYLEVDSIGEACLLEELNQIEELRIKTTINFLQVYNENHKKGDINHE